MLFVPATANIIRTCSSPTSSQVCAQTVKKQSMINPYYMGKNDPYYTDEKDTYYTGKKDPYHRGKKDPNHFEPKVKGS